MAAPRVPPFSPGAPPRLRAASGVLRHASCSRDGHGPGAILRPPGPRSAHAPPAAPCILAGMSLRLTVELVCDARRAPGCHGSYAARGEALPTVIFAVEEEAKSAGWGNHHGLRGVCPPRQQT